MYEIVGYIASILVAVSMLMTSLLRLRFVNLLGSTVFGVYGLLIHAYPVAAVNFFIAAINIVHIARMRRTKEFFTIVHVVPDSDYLHYFLEKNLNDIQKFNPGYRYSPAPNALTIFVVRDLQPAGLFIGQIQDGTLYISLDYVIPGYRDLKVGNYLLVDRADFFRNLGVDRIVSPGGNELHTQYLKRMGFVEENSGMYARRVA